MLSYVRPLDSTDVAYHVVASEDLIAWTTVEAVTLELLPIDDEREQVTIREAEPLEQGTSRRFLRVRIVVEPAPY